MHLSKVQRRGGSEIGTRALGALSQRVLRLSMLSVHAVSISVSNSDKEHILRGMKPGRKRDPATACQILHTWPGLASPPNMLIQGRKWHSIMRRGRIIII